MPTYKITRVYLIEADDKWSAGVREAECPSRGWFSSVRKQVVGK